MNEILVVRESQHPNIVNFLEFYLVESNELWVWVVMEYMDSEGGALTDIIENNTLNERYRVYVWRFVLIDFGGLCLIFLFYF